MAGRRRASLNSSSGELEDDAPTMNHTTGRQRVSFTALTNSLGGAARMRRFAKKNEAASSSAAIHESHGDHNNNNNSNSNIFDRVRINKKSRTRMARSRIGNQMGSIGSPRASATSFARTVLGMNADNTNPTLSDQDSNSFRRSVNRSSHWRYIVSEPVLVECPPSKNNWTSLVNRYGYPAGKGEFPEEMRGPYIYTLATVKMVHYEEAAKYYTVSRVDTGKDQRADAERMEPIRSRKSESVAREAATEAQRRTTESRYHDRSLSDIANQGMDSEHTEDATSNFAVCLELCLCILCLPFFWVRWLWEKSVTCGRALLRVVRKHAHLFLYGSDPYYCSVRFTMVNLLVLSGAWYNFVDQAMLAFLPDFDYSVHHIVSFVVWMVLVLELLFEGVIRPDGYSSLIRSEKAFEPATVRFVNRAHLVVEVICLVLYTPALLCLFISTSSANFNFQSAVQRAVLGRTSRDVFIGRLYLAFTRLRLFGLVRHFKKMWIMSNSTFIDNRWRIFGLIFPERIKHTNERHQEAKINKDQSISDKIEVKGHEKKEETLLNAQRIKTALMVTNGDRAMLLFFVLFGLYPLLFCAFQNGGANTVSHEMVRQLQENNLDLNQETDEYCTFLNQTIVSWALGTTNDHFSSSSSISNIYLLRLEVTPARCKEMWTGFTSTSIAPSASLICNPADMENCEQWIAEDDGEDALVFNVTMAYHSKIPHESITGVQVSTKGSMIYSNGTTGYDVEFKVFAEFNDTASLQPAAFSSLILQISMFFCILTFLSIMRQDAWFLAISPLRRMLKIVAQYAKNPLTIIQTTKNCSDGRDVDASEIPNSDEDGQVVGEELGSFETEQLITAVSKITDLLRKCWGVAGADIISTNLSRREGSLSEVFNPTVAGKSVYALFGFCAVNGFDHYLRCLGKDIMILINDVASVLHREVYRWGHAESGQCNKNLGSAWLMVYRIGNVKEVMERLEEATHVVFSGTTTAKLTSEARKQIKIAKRRGNYTQNGTGMEAKRASRLKAAMGKSDKAMSLSLASLPGIYTFTDRALIGMLKTFAGIYRDAKLLNWKNDFRLGAGVGAFSINMIFGMDAGWAVEGAVGSEYKIDATYLSPHVTMASRMMSACKQYGVSILLSQAVSELLSDSVQHKLRHLDTILVKGSSVKQRVYTYDARHKGVGFFLYNRSDEQADVDSDKYTPNVWNTDQDLCAMRQHITEDFLHKFNDGRDDYLGGNWPSAIKHLENANEIMIVNIAEEGYIEDELRDLHGRILDGEDARQAEQELRSETEAGPSRCLLTYMQSEGGVAPQTWKGYRYLTSK